MVPVQHRRMMGSRMGGGVGTGSGTDALAGEDAEMVGGRGIKSKSGNVLGSTWTVNKMYPHNTMGMEHDHDAL